MIHTSLGLAPLVVYTSMMRHVLSLFMLLAIGTLGCSDANPPVPDTDEGQLHLMDLDGNRAQLWIPGAAATVVLFARSDCPISNRYAPQVRRLFEQFYPHGVEFFLIYVDPEEAPEKIRTHLEEYRYPCQALRDPLHTLVALTGAQVTPEAAVFDGNHRMTYHGRIDDLYVDFGKSRAEATTHELADALLATLAGQDVVEPVTEAIGCYIGDLR